eukprot:GHVS01080778.1.p1 GENE.GHVS01080778.1~~GHVS01080778.1.p1  ORF type:complete len:418 (+),score=110.13 GHVS01080778.1:39-1292(+)
MNKPDDITSEENEDEEEDCTKDFGTARELTKNLFEVSYRGSTTTLGEAIDQLTDLSTKTPHTPFSRAEVVLSCRDGNRRSALHFACAGGRRDNAELLLHLAPELLKLSDTSGETPLFCAMRNKEEGDGLLLWLLSLDSEVNCVNKDGVGLVHLAVDRGEAHIVKILLHKRAQINLSSSSMGTPLFLSVSNKYVSITSLLLSHGADPNLPSSFPPPLLFCCTTGDVAGSRQLLDHGATATATDAEGWSCLHCAAERGSEECVQLLLAHQADCNVQTQGQTALDLAVQHNHSELAELLRPLTTTDFSREQPKEEGEEEILLLGEKRKDEEEEEQEEEEVQGEEQDRRKICGEKLKKEGNRMSENTQFAEAAVLYTEALVWYGEGLWCAEARGVLHSNRSYMRRLLGQHELALEDAMTVR